MGQKGHIKNELTEKQQKFLEIYENTAGFVSAACKSANIGRSTFYRWKEENEEFAERCKEIEEGVIDYTETKLLQAIKEVNVTAIIFYLKTKGKHRGYVEHTEVSGDLNLSMFEKNMNEQQAQEFYKRLNDEI